MHMTLLLIAILGCAVLCPQAAAGEADEFIRVSRDGWHFETSKTHTKFVPFGGVYYDPQTYTDEPYPRFLVIAKFEEARTDRHFARISYLGANLVRVTLSTATFSSEYRKLDEEAFGRLDRIIALARKHGLRVVLDLFVNWEGRSPWMAAHEEQFTDEKTIQGLEFLYRAFAGRYRNEPTVFSYLVCDEPTMPWDGKGMRDAWGVWVHRKYGSEDKLRKAWADYPTSGETWSSIASPPDENRAGLHRLLDYQRFREDTAAEFVRRLTWALRSQDRNHLISQGNLQWAAPLRVRGIGGRLLKPSSYPAFNPAKTGRYLDYMHINCYDWWDQNTVHFAQALGRYSYYPGKPVILGEFSFDPEVVKGCAGTFAGFCAWAFYPLPSEPSLHYLFDEKEQITEHGRAFEATSRKVRSGELALDRRPETEAIVVDPMDALTDISSTVTIYERYIKRAQAGVAVGLRMPDGPADSR